MKFIVFLLMMLLSIAESGWAGITATTTGDYFDGNGRYLGSDAVEDFKVYIAKSKESRNVKKALESGDALTAKSLSIEIPGRLVLIESLNVHKRTKANGGFREEVSLVFRNGTVIQGESGSIPIFKEGKLIAEFSVPRLPAGTKDGDVAALIHSHPISDTIENGFEYRFLALTPSEADRTTFRRFSTNIIVGSLRLKSFDSPLHEEERSLGIAVFNQYAELIISLKKEAVQRIIQKLEED